MLSLLAKFFKVLNSDASPSQISLGFAFALFVGLTPFFSLHNLFIFLLVCVIRVNLSAFLLASAVLALFAFFIDPLSISIGESLLSNPDLTKTWTQLYQSDIWRAFKFNHTLLLGSIVLSLMLFIPTFFITRIIIGLYRNRLMGWFEKLKISKLFKASKFYKVYEKLEA
ncbi:MAG: hypothetical protein ACI843_001311 [Psychrobacter glaciei]|jgi:uncharacterized protein (TIGR03546 family)